MSIRCLLGIHSWGFFSGYGQLGRLYYCRRCGRQRWA
jgi:hypothetical protein